MKTLNSVLN